MEDRAAVALTHDGRLFEGLLARAKSLEPDIRAGSMFGCPAAFVGRKMAFCVYGSEVGAKVPEATAAAFLAAGTARPFQPYGKSRMREWISLDQPLDEAVVASLLESAIAYARELSAPW